MGSSNSSANLPSPSQSPLGIDDNRTSTNEEARPIPYVAGWQRVGVTWLDAPRNQTSTPVQSAASGKSSKSTTSGYKYHADMVALVCLGPVDTLTHVFFDSQSVWSGVIERGATSSATITIEHKGPMTIYWGTADQPPNDALAAAGHPAYRNQCYVYFPQLGFGQDRTNAPNVEIGLRRRPFFDWLPSGAPADDCNPVVALADLFTNPLFGLGQRASLIDKPQWAAVAAQVASEDAVCSPYVSESTGVRQLITQLCEYFGGYLRWTADNKLQIGLFRDSPADLTALPKLTATDLLDAPEIDADEWSSTYNRTVITCLERGREWKEDYGQWLDQGNYALTGQTRFQQLERRWITRTDVATRLAARVGKQAALPQFNGTLRVRASSAETILVGDWLILDWDAWGFALVMQCTGRRIPSDATPEVELDVTGQQVSEDPAELYDRDDVINHSPGAPDVEALAQWRMVELPKALAAGAVAPTLAPLAVRGGFATVLSHVLDSQDGISYDILDDFTQFAVGGTLAADYPQATDPLDLSVGMLVNLLGPDLSLPGQSDIAMKNAKLLVFVGDEILSVRLFTYVSANQVRIFAKRGKFDTGQLAHAAGEQVYIIKKRYLARMTADAFSEAQQIAFKLQPASLGQQFDLSLVDPQTLTIVGRALMPQPFSHLLANGMPALAGATFEDGGGVVFSWTLETNETFGFEAPPEDYFEESGIETLLLIYDSLGSLTRKRKFVLEPGISTVTYNPGDMLADFGGAAPASFYVRLWSRKAGRKSYSYEEGTITKAGVAIVAPGVAAPLAMWRVLEVPRDLAQGAATPIVTVLAVRAVPETTRYRLYDSPDNDTYDRVTTRRKFAFGGTAAAAYPSTTDHIDLTAGLLVNLVGPDTTLPGQDALSMANAKLLVFMGDEILAVQTVSVISPTQVRLFCKRGKFDTGQLDHAAGEAVYIIPKRSLRLVDQDTFAADDSAYFKVQAATDELDGDLAAIAAQELAIIGRALLPQPFKNLIVNGTPALSSPTYAGGSDIAMAWTLTTNELYGNEAVDIDYFAQSGIATVINIYDSASSLIQKRHVRLDPGISTYTYADADLVADFGGRPASFYVRVYAKLTGRKSFSFEQATITKT